MMGLMSRLLGIVFFLHQNKYLSEMKYPQELGDVNHWDLYQPLQLEFGNPWKITLNILSKTSGWAGRRGKVGRTELWPEEWGVMTHFEPDGSSYLCETSDIMGEEFAQRSDGLILRRASFSVVHLVPAVSISVHHARDGFLQ